MGQLTNQFVSQSYQGILNLANANTGFTTNLQTITDGLGGSSPLQISQTQVNISGTFTVNGAPVSIDTGSLVTTSSFNAFTSSVDLRFDGIELETGSLQNQINQKLDTGSFNAYTSSNDSKVNSLIAGTGSYATTSSLSAVSQSIASTDLAQDNRLTAIESITGSLATTGSLNSYTLTSSFNAYTSSNDSKVNSLIAATASYVTETESGSFVTNVFQNPFLFNQINVTKGNGSTTTLTINNVTSASFANNATSSSFAQNALSASYAPDISNRNGLITTGSIGGSQSITGSLNVEGTISATSASFTYVNTVYETASVIYSSGSNQLGDASNDTQTLWGTVNLPSGPLVITGSVTSTGGFTGSLQGTASYATNALSSSHAINADTASFFNGLIASASYAVNADTASIANDLIVRGKCDNTGGLLRGTIVRIIGADGDNPLFDSASWTDDANSANTLGMLSENVAHNGFANVVVQGKVIGINTVGMNAGDLLFLSSSGQYTTSSVPAPYHEVRLGQVLRANLNNGSAYVTIDNGYELTELHDVDIQSVQVGDVLTYVSGAYGQWVNKTVDELGYLQTSSFNTYTASMDARTGSYATTGSNIFRGNQTLTGSFNQTGSMSVIGNPSNPSATIARFGDPSYGVVDISGNGQLTATNAVKLTQIENWNTVGTSAITVVNTLGDIYLTPKATGSVIIGQNQSHKAIITGSINVSGSANFVGDVSLNAIAPNDFKQNLVLLSSKNSISSSAILQSYLNAVTTSLDSDDFNFAFGPVGSALGAPGIAGATGSYFISGSNNFIMNLQSQLPLSQGRRAVLGSVNLVQSAGLNVNTSSLTIPAVNNNYFGGTITATYTTGSNAGNQAHQVSSNFLLSSVNLNHQSASITTPGQVSSFTQNAVIGSLNSNASGSLLTNPINIAQNIAAGTILNLNHLSSSINFTNNIHVGGGTNNINSSYFQTGSNNSVSVGSNFIGGQSVTLNFGGSPSTNVSRTFVGNLVGGQNTTISMQAANTDLGGLRNSVVWGIGLVASGSHSAATLTQQGAAFLGRYNGQDNGLADSARTVFAVGTGFADGNRRTSLWVDSGSFVGVSGSLNVIGNGPNVLNVTGGMNISSSAVTALNVTGALNVIGNTFMSSSTTQPLTIDGTINLKRLHFDKNPFNNNPSSNLGAIRMAADNQTFQYTNYDTAQITTQSFIDQIVNTGSLTTQTRFGAAYNNTVARLDVINNNGSRRVDILTDSMTVTGSMNISSIMNMRPLDPLPAGNIGDLAVSSSNQLYFYNGAWTLVV